MVRPSQAKADVSAPAVSVGSSDAYAALEAAAPVGPGAEPDLNLPYPNQARAAIKRMTSMFFTYPTPLGARSNT